MHHKHVEVARLQLLQALFGLVHGVGAVRLGLGEQEKLGVGGGIFRHFPVLPFRGELLYKTERESAEWLDR